MHYDLADAALRKELLLFAVEHELSAIPPQPGVSGKKFKWDSGQNFPTN